MASSQMQVAGIRAQSQETTEVCETAKALEQPSWPSNANATSGKVFCSVSADF